MNELFATVVFVYNNIIYLPHYNIRNNYVSPGFGKHHHNTWTKKELIDAGATQQVMPLWNRSW